ncbi:roadblock/LC7 domain-containing protein [Agromyces intestinalis]|uniref:Roadblock/LC7 domain-containing protein n=1 Tax=Agromyces intestinalis TaxID=2592652 RepID=A0A5C1YGN6_9MICO|nr:roadblock/LC7 domain-containing protein [Agromyces intestinalis]
MGRRVTTAPANLDWLVDSLTQRTPDVAHAILVSADGLPMARSAGFPPDRADQLAAITSGLTSLTQGAARALGAGQVHQMVVEMDGGYLVVMSVGEGSSLAALAAPQCDLGQVGYQMQLLIARVATALTPEIRTAARSGA